MLFPGLRDLVQNLKREEQALYSKHLEVRSEMEEVKLSCANLTSTKEK